MLYISILLLITAPGAAAQDPGSSANPPSNWQYSFSGYYKSLFIASKSFFTNQRYEDSLNRLRLNLEAKWDAHVLFHVEFDNEVHVGNDIRLPDFQTVTARQDGAYLNLQHVLVDEDHLYWDTSVYRAYVTIREGAASLTVGRQRIAWGTARFWSPADVFNPISPLQLEPEERQGVDAVQLEYQLPRQLTATLVYAPQNGFNRSTSAVRIAGTFHNYDVAVFTGRFGQDWIGGGTFAGQVKGAGLHGEGTYTRGGPGHPNALRMAIGADYGFRNTLYIAAQYFYNQGQPDLPTSETREAPATPPSAEANAAILFRFTNQIFTLHRHFVSAGVGYDVTPLIKVEADVVTDVSGRSAFVMPSIKYNLSPNTDLSAGAELFASSAGGEFHGIPAVVFAQFWWHF